MAGVSDDLSKVCHQRFKAVHRAAVIEGSGGDFGEGGVRSRGRRDRIGLDMGAVLVAGKDIVAGQMDERQAARGAQAGQASQRRVGGLLYVARADNHAYLRPAPLPELAAHIARSRGPSGSNRDYLLALADALRELDEEDPHVLALEALLLEPQA